MSDPVRRLEFVKLESDHAGLAATVESNHRRSNDLATENKEIAVDNRRRLDELVGRSGTLGIVEDIHEMRTEQRETRAVVEEQGKENRVAIARQGKKLDKIVNNNRRGNLFNVGGAAGGGGVMVILLEVARGFGWL